ncbi:hypothetical protein [Ralstonia solanacearum]|uniref:hypothetical protein n=1 Tax=Ralstonia solanacearum TaxID=305 RepID=UPI0001D97B15|nr:hypothetical protein [Ralstonia solanacearum]CBJ52312.1 exported protein of unknown function, putative lipoprotein [Ralstonia solanacearum PSI07]
MHRWLVIAVVGLVIAAACPARADELSDRMALWEAKALLCNPGAGAVPFPSKQTNDTAQPCDDGDMTLFNGLLCAAGDERGCQAVVDAQDPATGEWFRSPRRRLHQGDFSGASFSPDMALGLQLYLITKKDAARAHKWLLWMDQHVACSIEAFGVCLLRALPRFCTNDAPDAGCTLRPGDAAMLAATVNYLERNASMPALPDGRLRGYLGSFSGYGPAITELDAMLNKPGYSQHLVAVGIMAMRAMGQTDTRIQDAAHTLAQREPNNAFFAWLDEGNTGPVHDQVLARCPAPATILKQPLNQWQWERADADHAWESSCYWDCVFMARLIRQ